MDDLDKNKGEAGRAVVFGLNSEDVSRRSLDVPTHYNNRLKITSCTVTNKFNDLLKFSIRSIVNIIDEILIFDDSNDDDYINTAIYDELLNYNNVRIVKNTGFGKDLGKKKQHLVDIASNEIVLRWDDDFILYDIALLNHINKLMNDENIDYVITHNYNIAFMLNFVNNSKIYCNETYIYKKHIIQFKNFNGFPDFPFIIVDQTKLKSKELDHCLFLHMWNFKSYEALLFRTWMCPFLLNEIYDDYYEWLYNKETDKFIRLTSAPANPDISNVDKTVCDNSRFNSVHASRKSLIKRCNYTFNTLITFKRKKLNYIMNHKKLCDILKPNELLINFTNIDAGFIEYVNKTYSITKLNTDMSKEFKFNTYETDNLVNIFYWGGNYEIGNFGDILSYYLFEKMTGYTHNYYNILEHFCSGRSQPNDDDKTTKESDSHFITIGSIINYSNVKSIIWGTGIININLKDKIKYDKICCVRGPRTRSALAEHDIFIDERYGDPALLTPLLYQPIIRKKYRIGIIPHNIDYNDIISIFPPELYSNIKIIKLAVNKNDSSIENVVDDINSCEFIFSSSLHGIILSNSYNIPVIRFKHNQLSGDDIKFIDYFESVYSDKYLCESKIHIKELVDNFNTVCKIYKTPDLIQARQIDLIETCPFLRSNMKRLLGQGIKS